METKTFFVAYFGTNYNSTNFQIVICKEEDDHTTTDDESPAKQKKRDPNKVEKKFLWPHGITPPLKNVRKRRFRKTLKKKYVEAPEIEKEVSFNQINLYCRIIKYIH